MSTKTSINCRDALMVKKSSSLLQKKSLLHAFLLQIQKRLDKFSQLKCKSGFTSEQSAMKSLKFPKNNIKEI